MPMAGSGAGKPGDRDQLRPALSCWRDLRRLGDPRPRGAWLLGWGGLAVLLTCVRSARADRWRSDQRPQGGVGCWGGALHPSCPPPPGGRGLRDPGLSPVRSASPFRAARWRRSAEAGLPGSTDVLWPYMRVASATGWLLGPRPPGAGTSRVPTFPRSCSASPCRAAV
jgi:hypothetical protein